MKWLRDQVSKTLKSHLDTVAYDGATNFAALAEAYKTSEDDYITLFTDGLDNLDATEDFLRAIQQKQSALYVFSNYSTLNGPY